MIYPVPSQPWSDTTQIPEKIHFIIISYSIWTFTRHYRFPQVGEWFSKLGNGPPNGKVVPHSVWGIVHLPGNDLLQGTISIFSRKYAWLSEVGSWSCRNIWFHFKPNEAWDLLTPAPQRTKGLKCEPWHELVKPADFDVGFRCSKDRPGRLADDLTLNLFLQVWHASGVSQEGPKNGGFLVERWPLKNQ